MAMVSVVGPHIGPVPQDLGGMVLSIAYEAMFGILIGFCLQALVAAIQMAGSVLDLQLGLSGSQIFDPISGTPSSILSQVKMWCAVVLIFAMNGHHMMLQAVVSSYNMPALTMEGLPQIQSGLTHFLGQLMMLSMQIAAPVAAVAFIVDAASALVNKAVPQFQVFAIITPAKISLGLVAVMAALPVMATAVTSGVQHTFKFIEVVVGGQ